MSKHLLLAGIFGLAFLISGCKSGPQIDECLLTYVEGLPPIGDCVRPDKTTYECSGSKCLDGVYFYSAADRAALIKWAKANCKK